MRLQVVPPRLADAALPLADAARSIRTVTNCRREVLALVDTDVVRDALADFLSAWELAAWAAADSAATLAAGLDQAGATYRAADRL
jgi:hypothetical protein